MSLDFTDFIEKHKDLKYKRDLIINGKEKVLKEKTRWYHHSDVKKFVKNNQDEIIFGFDWSFIVFKDFIYGDHSDCKEDSRKVSFNDLDKIKIKVGKKDHGIYFEGEESVKFSFVFAGHHNKAFDLTISLFEEFKNYIKSQIGESQVEVIEEEDQKLQVKESQVEVIDEEDQKPQVKESQVEVIDEEDQKPQVKESQVEVIDEELEAKFKKISEYRKSIKSKIVDLIEKYKNESWMMSAKEVNKKRNSFFDNRFKSYKKLVNDDEILCGVNGSNSGGLIVSDYYEVSQITLLGDLENPTLTSYGRKKEDYKKDDVTNWRDVKLEGNINGSNIRFDEDAGTFELHKSVSMSSADLADGVYFGSGRYPHKVSLKKGAVKFVKELLEIADEERVNSNKQSKNSFLSKYDKDGNGVLDIVDSGGDLSELVKKNQKIIIEQDKNYLNELIKLSIFLKTKRKNIQSLFDSLEGSLKDFDEVLDTIKIQIETYSKLASLSMRMVNCLIDDDLFTYLEIYNGFESIGVFRSSFENELSSQLKDIGSNMGEIINSINEMDSNITSNLDEISSQLDTLND